MTLVEINSLIEQAIQFYSSKERLDEWLVAQKQYESLVGEVSQEQDEYEQHMNSFYEWFLFSYRPNEALQTKMEIFLLEQNTDEETLMVMRSIELSLFEYLGSSLFKKNVYVDHGSGKKFSLSRNHRELFFIKEDIFLGHRGQLDGEFFFLEGLMTLARESKKVVLKELKQIRKEHNPWKLLDFFYQTSKLNSRFQHYKHVPVEKIFKYDYVSE